MPVDDDAFQPGIAPPPQPPEKLVYEPPENEEVAHMIREFAKEHPGWDQTAVYVYFRDKLEGTNYRITQEIVNFVLACPCHHLHNLTKGS